jgi:hypothetical protein
LKPPRTPTISRSSSRICRLDDNVASATFANVPLPRDRTGLAECLNLCWLQQQSENAPPHIVNGGLSLADRFDLDARTFPVRWHCYLNRLALLENLNRPLRVCVRGTSQTCRRLRLGVATRPHEDAHQRENPKSSNNQAGTDSHSVPPLEVCHERRCPRR